MPELDSFQNQNSRLLKYLVELDFELNACAAVATTGRGRGMRSSKGRAAGRRRASGAIARARLQIHDQRGMHGAGKAAGRGVSSN
jgi:hypothetical protein